MTFGVIGSSFFGIVSNCWLNSYGKSFFAICEKPEGGGADNRPPGRVRVKKHATNTIEVHGFRQRLQDSLLHMLPVSVPWVVLVLTLVLFRFIGFGESGPASGQDVARPCPEDIPTDQVKDGSDPSSYSGGCWMAQR